MVKAGKAYASELRHQEEAAMAQKLRELEMERSQQQLLQKKLKAEHDLALAEKEKKEQELALAEKEKKEHELLAQTYKTKGLSERRKKWLFILWSVILTLAIAGYFWYDRVRTENKNKAILIDQTKDSLAESKKDARRQARYNAALAREKRLTELKNDSLNKLNKQYDELLIILNKNAKELKMANEKLKRKSAYLVKESVGKDTIIEKYKKDYNDLKAAQSKVDTIKH